MLETSCLDEVQKNKQTEGSGVLVPTSGEHYFDSSRENRWQEETMAPSLPETCHAVLIFSWPLKFTSRLNCSPVTDTQNVAEVQNVFARTPYFGVAKLVLQTRCTDTEQRGSWTPWQLIFGLRCERSVFVLDELETDLLPASLSKCSSSNQTGLVDQDCGCKSILVFHLELSVWETFDPCNFLIRK